MKALDKLHNIVANLDMMDAAEKEVLAMVVLNGINPGLIETAQVVDRAIMPQSEAFKMLVGGNPDNLEALRQLIIDELGGPP